MVKRRNISLKPTDLLKTAEHLINTGAGKPLDANLRRAMSSVYYALFHTLADDAANLLIGKPQQNRNNSAWRQTYRALQHRRLKDAVSGAKYKRRLPKFPKAIRDFAATMASMQEERHAADYDPFAKITKSSVSTQIKAAETSIARYKKAPKYDRRAFCAFILLELRE